jgi:hypothetical protein
MREAFCIYTQHCVLIGGGMIKAQQNQLYLLSFECSTAFAEKTPLVVIQRIIESQ